MLAVVGSAVLGAALAAAAASLTWTTDDRAGALTGPAQQSGADVVPELVPVALVALAGVGATFATRGWARRMVGVLVAAGGLLLAVRSAAAWVAAAGAVRPLGPLLAVLSGLLVLAAGALIAAGVGARRLGARYDAPTAGMPTADARRAGADPADVDLWRALDAGADPTLDPADEPSPDPTADPTPDPGAGRGAEPAIDPVHAASDSTPAGGYDDRVARPGQPPAASARTDSRGSPSRSMSRNQNPDTNREANG